MERIDFSEFIESASRHGVTMTELSEQFRVLSRELQRVELARNRYVISEEPDPFD